MLLGADAMFALNMTLQDEGYSDDYDPTVDPSIANHFAAAAFRFAHTLLPVSDTYRYFSKIIFV